MQALVISYTYDILQPYLIEAIKGDALDIAQWGKRSSCCGTGFDLSQRRLYGRFGSSRGVSGSAESCTRSEEDDGAGG